MTFWGRLQRVTPNAAAHDVTSRQDDLGGVGLLASPPAHSCAFPLWKRLGRLLFSSSPSLPLSALHQFNVASNRATIVHPITRHPLQLQSTATLSHRETPWSPPDTILAISRRLRPQSRPLLPPRHPPPPPPAALKRVETGGCIPRRQLSLYG